MWGGGEPGDKGEERAFMTFPRVRRDWFMFMPSRRRVGREEVVSGFSEPVVFGTGFHRG